MISVYKWIKIKETIIEPTLPYAIILIDHQLKTRIIALRRIDLNRHILDLVENWIRHLILNIRKQTHYFLLLYTFIVLLLLLVLFSFDTELIHQSLKDHPRSYVLFSQVHHLLVIVG